MNGLEIADLVVIACRALGLDTGQVLDLLDPAAAERALAQAQPGGETGPAGPAAQAAALLHALVRERPLRRGNQQVALAATLQFLALNGCDLDPDPSGAIAAAVAGIASGALTTQDLVDWLAPRVHPSGGAGARGKEAPMRGRPALPLAERLRRATTRRQPRGTFRRYTDRARRAVVLAQQEARLLHHNYIGTEHLLLGLLREGEGVAAMTLESLGVSREAVRGQVEEIIGRSLNPPATHIPFTPRAKKVLELSLREALALGHHYVGTEHLLLGLLREGHGVAAQVLVRVGADHSRVRERTLDLLTGRLGRPDPEGQWAGDIDVQAVVEENQRLQGELDRLRSLLREHGIEPDGGAAQSA